MAEKIKRIRKPLVATKSYEATLKLNKLYATVRFPAAVAKYLKISSDGKVHFTATSGVIQLSSQKPTAVIPLLTKIK